MDTVGWLLLLGFIAVVLWIYGIVDIIKGVGQGKRSKMLWLAVVIFFPIVGVILYFIFGKNYGRTRV